MKKNKFFKKKNLKKLFILFIILCIIFFFRKNQKPFFLKNSKKEKFSYFISPSQRKPQHLYNCNSSGCSASIGENMSLIQGSIKPSATQSIAIAKPIYQTSILQRKLGFIQTLNNAKIKPVVPFLKAMVNKDPPRINIHQKIPFFLLREAYKEELKNYTLKNLLQEIFVLFKKTKPYFDRKNATKIYEKAERLLQDHYEKTKKLQNSTELPDYFPYQKDSQIYKDYEAEMIDLDRREPKPGIKRDTEQRKLIIKYSKDLPHLEYGMIGLDEQGKRIMEEGDKKQYNEIVKEAHKEFNCLALLLVTHHIDPRFTSDQNFELGFNMPDTLIKSPANQVSQFKIPNQLMENLTDFSLKESISKTEKEGYSLGYQTFSYSMRNKLNPKTPGKPKIKPTVNCIISATSEEDLRAYFEQEEAIKKRSLTYKNMIKANEDAKKKGKTPPMKEEDLRVLTFNNKDFDETVETLRRNQSDQREDYKNEEKLKRSSSTPSQKTRPWD